jgi:hypothetical protein
VTRANNIDHVNIVVADEKVQMRLYEDDSRARPPVACDGSVSCLGL